MKLALHVDGGKGVGLGHVTRGIALSFELQALGITPVFLISPESSLAEFLSRYPFPVRVCDPRPESLLAACRAEGMEALVLDSYKLDAVGLRHLRHGGLPLICFDDLARKPLPADLVINGSPGAHRLPYEQLTSAELLLGPSYQVLRPEFQSPVERDYALAPRSILVTLGGDDLANAMTDLSDFFKASAAFHPDMLVHFVIGPYFERADGEWAPNHRVHRAPRDMRSLMRGADIAISAGGQTLYELARCSVPTLAFCTGQDQQGNLEALAALGCIRYLGWVKREGWLHRLEENLTVLLEDPLAREALGRQGSLTIDGQGAGRVATAIKVLVARREGA